MSRSPEACRVLWLLSVSMAALEVFREAGRPKPLWADGYERATGQAAPSGALVWSSAHSSQATGLSSV